jgi:hypothetical protein
MKPATKQRPPVGREAGANKGTAGAPIVADPVENVEQMLEIIRRFESTARTIADDDVLTVKARCRALLDLMARARRRDGAAFLEVAIWRGCRHFFEPDPGAPRDAAAAGYRLLRQGHDRCPECRRPLPSRTELDHWRELAHDYRRTT